MSALDARMSLMGSMLLEEGEVSYGKSFHRLNDVSSRIYGTPQAITCNRIEIDADDIGKNPTAIEIQTPTIEPALFAHESVIVRTISPGLKSSRFLEHMKNQIGCLRHKFGDELCIFKIGISSSIINRWSMYKDENFAAMVIVFASNSLIQVETFESCLIDAYRGLPQCRNQLGGGESMRKRGGLPRHGGPYYVYCVAARADARYGIGG